MQPLPVGNPNPSPAVTKTSLAVAGALPLGGAGAPLRPAASPPAPAARRIQRSYPALLIASTVLSAVFCYLYVTKPVVVTAGAAAPREHNPPSAADSARPAAKPVPATAGTPARPTPALLPAGARLPGDTTGSAPAPAATLTATAAPCRPLPVFEETNLRIQHVLDASAPGGDLRRLVLEVPVLYKTGNLAWTPDQVAEARDLLAALNLHQEKARALREEGTQLLAAWQRLMEKSTPAPVLRADSPSVPANRNPDPATGSAPTGDSTRAIQVQTSVGP